MASRKKPSGVNKSDKRFDAKSVLSKTNKEFEESQKQLETEKKLQEALKIQAQQTKEQINAYKRLSELKKQGLEYDKRAFDWLEKTHGSVDNLKSVYDKVSEQLTTQADKVKSLNTEHEKLNKEVKRLSTYVDDLNNSIDRALDFTDDLNDAFSSLSTTMAGLPEEQQGLNKSLDTTKASLSSISSILKNQTDLSEKQVGTVLAAADAYADIPSAIASAQKQLKKGQITLERYNDTILEAYESFEGWASRIDTSTQSGKELKKQIDLMGHSMKGFADAAKSSQSNMKMLDTVMEGAGSDATEVFGQLKNIIGNLAKGEINLVKVGFQALAVAVAATAIDYWFTKYEVAIEHYYQKLKNTLELQKQLAELKYDFSPEVLEEKYIQRTSINAKRINAEEIKDKIKGEVELGNIRKKLQLEILRSRLDSDKTIRNLEIEASFAAQKSANAFSASMKEAAAQFRAASKTALFGNKLGGVGYGAAQLQMAGISAEKIAEAMSQSAAESGKMRSAQLGADMAIMAERSGQSVSNIAALNDLFERTDKVSANTALNLQEGMRELASKAGISYGNLMREVADASKEALGYQIKSGKALAKQVAYSQSMGVNFNDVAKAGKSMVLNYKESIKAEMELSTLLGEQVDLSEVRARFAEGDTSGAIEALKSQGLNPEDMDMFQQQALSQALGGLDLASLQKIATRTGKTADLTAGEAGPSNKDFLSRKMQAEATLNAEQARISADQAIIDAKLSQKILEAQLGGYLNNKETRVADALTKVASGQTAIIKRFPDLQLTAKESQIDAALKAASTQVSAGKAKTIQEAQITGLDGKVVSYSDFLKQMGLDPASKEYAAISNKIKNFHDDFKATNEEQVRMAFKAYENVSNGEFELIKKKKSDQDIIFKERQSLLEQDFRETQNSNKINELVNHRIGDKNDLLGREYNSTQYSADVQEKILQYKIKQSQLQDKDLIQNEIDAEKLKKEQEAGGSAAGLLKWAGISIGGMLFGGAIKSALASATEKNVGGDKWYGKGLRRINEIVSGKSINQSRPSATPTPPTPPTPSIQGSSSYQYQTSSRSSPSGTVSRPETRTETRVPKRGFRDRARSFTKSKGGKASLVALGALTAGYIASKFIGGKETKPEEKQEVTPVSATAMFPQTIPGAAGTLPVPSLDPKSAAGTVEVGTSAALANQDPQNQLSYYNNSPMLAVSIMKYGGLDAAIVNPLKDQLVDVAAIQAETGDIFKREIKGMAVDLVKSKATAAVQSKVTDKVTDIGQKAMKSSFIEKSITTPIKNTAQKISEKFISKTGETFAKKEAVDVAEKTGTSLISKLTQSTGLKTITNLGSKAAGTAASIGTKFSASAAGNILSKSMGSGPLGIVTGLVGSAASLYGDLKKEEAMITGDKSALTMGRGMSAAGTALEYAGIGATLGSIIPGIGTAVGAAVGGIIGGIKGIYDNWFSDEAKAQSAEVERHAANMASIKALIEINKSVDDTINRDLNMSMAMKEISDNEPAWRESVLRQLIEMTRLSEMLLFKGEGSGEVMVGGKKVKREFQGAYDKSKMVAAERLGTAEGLSAREQHIANMQASLKDGVITGNTVNAGKTWAEYVKSTGVTKEELEKLAEKQKLLSIASQTQATKVATSVQTKTGTTTASTTTTGANVKNNASAATAGGTPPPATSSMESILTTIRDQAHLRGIDIGGRITKVYDKLVNINGNAIKTFDRSDKIAAASVDTNLQIKTMNTTITTLKAVVEGVQKLLDAQITGTGGNISLMIDGKQVTRVIQRRTENKSAQDIQ